MIAADTNQAPKRNDGQQLTLLRFSSDLMFLEWQNHCDNADVEVGNLKHVFRVAIINDNTKFIIAQALQRSGDTIGTWPNRVTYQKGSDGYTALLGTPNVAGTGIMLCK
jgi:hypothetical protein